MFENHNSEMNQGVSIISDEELINDLEGVRQRFCTKLDMGDDPACSHADLSDLAPDFDKSGQLKIERVKGLPWLFSLSFSGLYKDICSGKYTGNITKGISQTVGMDLDSEEFNNQALIAMLKCLLDYRTWFLDKKTTAEEIVKDFIDHTEFVEDSPWPVYRQVSKTTGLSWCIYIGMNLSAKTCTLVYALPEYAGNTPLLIVDDFAHLCQITLTPDTYAHLTQVNDYAGPIINKIKDELAQANKPVGTLEPVFGRSIHERIDRIDPPMAYGLPILFARRVFHFLQIATAMHYSKIPTAMILIRNTVPGTMFNMP